MAKVTISGTPGKKYDLDVISKTDLRTDDTSPLSVQVWYWSPNSTDTDHTKQDPPNPVIGQIWLSKLVSDPDLVEKYNSEGWDNIKIGGDCV